MKPSASGGMPDSSLPGSEEARPGLHQVPATEGGNRPLPRRLPVVVLPRVGESLFSWVDHLAFVHEVDRAQIMDVLGLTPKAAHAARLTRHTAELPLPEALALHTATGLGPQELRSMTLFGIVEESEGRLYRHPEFPWAPEETWAFCPLCLAPPVRWPLWWYQPWAVMCPRHGCYTVSFCPDCGSPFSPSTLRGDAPGRCPGFLTRADEPRVPPPAGKRRTKRKRCGRPLWEIETPTVTDPTVRRVHHRLARLHTHGSTPTKKRQQWYDDVRTLSILLTDPHPCRVRIFTSCDPALQQRFRPEDPARRRLRSDVEEPPQSMWSETNDSVHLRTSDSGFLHPWRVTAPTVMTKQRDPVTAAAKLCVIGQILDSQDIAATVQDVLTVPRPASLRDFDDHLPSYMRRASPQLRELLAQALDPQALAQLQEQGAEDTTSP